MKNTNKLACLFTTMAMLSAACSYAQAVIHEPFEYAEGNVGGLNGGVGFAGAWSNTRNSPTVVAPGFDWGGLVTTGNAVSGNAWSGLVRPIGTSLSGMGLMDNGSSLWFSAVMDLSGQNFTNADLNLALGSAAKFNSSDYNERLNLDGANAEGIGFTHTGGTIQGAYWQDIGDADGVSERSTSNSTLSLSSGAARALVVGRIDWGATNVASETLTLYAPSTTLELGSPILNSFSIPALDQSTFDSLLIQFKDTPKIDEIRFGSVVEDVVVLPDPLKLQVNTITGQTKLIGDDDANLSISYYQVTSAGNSLSPTGWNSFADQDIDGNGPADGSGNGWEEAGGARPGALAEAYLLGETTILAGAEFDLGMAYDTSVDAQDLVLQYITGDGNRFDGVIEYLSLLIGDMNNDTLINNLDINPFVLALTDPQGYQDAFGIDPDLVGDVSGDGVLNNLDINPFVALLTGQGAASAEADVAAAFAAVPEPSSFALLFGGIFLANRRIRR